MEFFELVRTRRSVREFSNRGVRDEDLKRIVAAANAAPSAGNLQAYAIHVIEDRDTRLALARAAWDQDFVARAPVVLVFSAHPARSARRYGVRGESLYAIQDATIACAFAMLAAHAAGFGSVWVGAFDEEAARRAIGAPAGLKPIAILPIGHPAESPEPTPRRPLEDIVHRLRGF